METNQTIKVRSRYSKDIPFGKSYIIKEGREYKAFVNIYNTTFKEICSSLKEASKYIKKFS
ncbi:hypothetical protein cd3_093 [Carnobacterium phage cd3]|uniref:Uncharacterized protein n=1 Tax=Carnobacterium phage cd2 TaxID=2849244 RepID=A0AAE7SQE2_9CAUD|nr:hypothetical protein PQD68_gp093 [Carnobacterium phage cd2]QXP45219.1 hypothetical protein cd2_093 [Carnobacterium phage cd2]QXP45226.1 hypothetical protein cd3_093 [Carnobacterium phage cd3]